MSILVLHVFSCTLEVACINLSFTTMAGIVQKQNCKLSSTDTCIESENDYIEKNKQKGLSANLVCSIICTSSLMLYICSQ